MGKEDKLFLVVKKLLSSNLRTKPPKGIENISLAGEIVCCVGMPVTYRNINVFAFYFEKQKSDNSETHKNVLFIPVLLFPFWIIIYSPEIFTVHTEGSDMHQILIAGAPNRKNKKDNNFGHQ